MGLDILVITDNFEQIVNGHVNEYTDVSNEHSLSRTFCDFMCRRVIVEHTPELDQIGNITGVDIIPFYDMEAYPDQEGLEFFLETAESEEERMQILAEAETDKAKVSNNIDLILQILSVLIERLSTIDNLPDLLLETDVDTLNNATYFADFNIDKGEGYIGNNFGQDLRNFKRFLEYAKLHGSNTVWFEYN
ncbi:hypothetical protein Q765_18515 [Flavobacterium rivuli WB 3.3-2 = DSM 21788]|uniref:Uncharacterized protein n=1 Tax=Flavobacterium rivuli WB 3.3-2 = DSM 21788 TaxID=1121895 RepID=A0A0A2M0L0_9FLAO|nr:hypothetical protein [Flavobacterium rivuli]KGO85008.1 hypothetical protein Q765_18515 [Flavobacterium rivuli WB 3.3-2 = DSM 21788]